MANHPQNVIFLNNLKTQSLAFQKQVEATYRDPSGRNVHSLRVISRRLRAAIWLAKNGTPGIRANKLTSSLRQLGKVLGDCRETDVAIQDAVRYKLHCKKLKSRQQKLKEKLVAELRPKRQKEMIRQIATLGKNLKGCKEMNFSPALAKIRKRNRRWFRSGKITKDNIHKLRIATKKTRYALEALGRPSGGLKELQGVLGRIHDLEVLQSILGTNSKVKKDIKKLCKKANRVFTVTEVSK